MAGDVGLGRGAEEGDGHTAATEHVLLGHQGHAPAAGVADEAGAGAFESDAGLGIERRRADDDAPVPPGVVLQKGGDQGSRDFVLSRLPREHDGELDAGTGGELAAERAEHTGLVVPEGGEVAHCRYRREPASSLLWPGGTARGVMWRRCSRRVSLAPAPVAP